MKTSVRTHETNCDNAVAAYARFGLTIVEFVLADNRNAIGFALDHMLDEGDMLADKYLSTIGADSMASHKRKPMHKRDVFHAFMVQGAQFEGKFDMPRIEGAQEASKGLVPFSEAMSESCCDFDCHVMFYEDDFRFERLWAQPRRYEERLKKFAGGISADFSTCTDFPGALKVWNTYRDRVTGFWLQRRLGMHVIPNVRVEKLTRDWALDGLPRESLIAVGARACVKDRRLFCEGLRIACDELRPTGIVWYGADAYGVSDYPRELGIPIHIFKGRGRGKLDDDRHDR